MNPNKALWEKGDFTRIAETMRESGEVLVGQLGSPKGSRFWILDAAMGRRLYQRRNSERTCWASMLQATLSKREIGVQRRRASRTAGSSWAMRRICTS